LLVHNVPLVRNPAARCDEPQPPPGSLKGCG
jgi:hypothetical protein